MAEHFREENLTPENSKVNYWDDFAQKHFPEMRLLFRGGKLWEKEEWRNVAEHCLVEAAASEVLSDALHLPAKEKEELVKSAICHDWNKHMDVKPDDFTDKDYKKAKILLKKINPNPTIMAATNPEFIERLAQGESTLLERLQFYIDEICTGADIVSVDQRINEVQQRHPKLNEIYWEKDRKLAHTVEAEVFGLLQQQGVSLETPENVPDYIKSKIEEKYATE